MSPSLRASASRSNRQAVAAAPYSPREVVFDNASELTRLARPLRFGFPRSLVALLGSHERLHESLTLEQILRRKESANDR